MIARHRIIFAGFALVLIYLSLTAILHHPARLPRLPPPAVRRAQVAAECARNPYGYCAAIRWQLAGGPTTTPPHPAHIPPLSSYLYKISAP